MSAPAETETRHTPWRTNIEAFAVAIIMALLLKQFVIEAYKIPTGSMQPTLIGDARSGTFDRILVDKVSYRFRAPRRWEVAVFRYPLDRSKNFVKRIVGVGPEEFRIFDGDLWNRSSEKDEWTVLRKPPGVQGDLWKALDRESSEESSWTVDSGGTGWIVEGRRVEAHGAGRARFHAGRGLVLDHYGDGYPEELAKLGHGARRSGENAVGDLRVDGTIEALPGTETVAIVIREDRDLYYFRVPGPASPGVAVPGIMRSRPSDPVADIAPTLADGEPWRLVAGKPVRFAAQNLDDRLELFLDGDLVASLAISRPPDMTTDQRSRVHLAVTGEGAIFEDLMVYRDVFYLADSAKTAEVAIPEGHFFMLGDNTQDSSDSREWILARFNTRDGERATGIVRGNFRRGENPLMVGAGDPEGPFTRFRDEWGEEHWFGRNEAERIAPEVAPFVPRSMVLGRAMAVFWPIRPWDGIVRLKRVH